MARLSPTRIMSTPAASAMREPGASYAVTMTSGSAPSRTLRARTAGTVTRAAEDGVVDGAICSPPDQVQRPVAAGRQPGRYDSRTPPAKPGDPATTRDPERPTAEGRRA